MFAPGRLFAPEADRWSAHADSCWWDRFYADRSQPVPFFVAKPDENLVSYLARGWAPSSPTPSSTGTPA